MTLSYYPLPTGNGYFNVSLFFYYYFFNKLQRLLVKSLLIYKNHTRSSQALHLQLIHHTHTNTCEVLHSVQKYLLAMASYSSLQVTILLSIFFLSVNANEVTVGGKTGDWKIPSSSSFSFNEWADKSRFLLGDYLGKLQFLISFFT